MSTEASLVEAVRPLRDLIFLFKFLSDTPFSSGRSVLLLSPLASSRYHLVTTRLGLALGREKLAASCLVEVVEHRRHGASALEAHLILLSVGALLELWELGEPSVESIVKEA